jgi:hypothetical protein
MSNPNVEPTPAQLAAGLHEQHAVTRQLQQQLQQLQQQLQSQTNASPIPGQHESKQKDPTPIKPASFDGHPKSNPDRWLKEMERYLRVSHLNPDRWVEHCAAYLRESASTWMDEIEQSAEFEGIRWAAFCKLFIDRFRPLEASRTARSILKTIKQRTSVDEYNNRFREQIKYCSDMAMEDQLLSYCSGLKPEIESEIYRLDPKTVDEAMRSAVRLDMRMFIRQRERSNNGRFNSHPQRQGGYNRDGHQHANRGQQHGSSSAPMDLGAIDDNNSESERDTENEEGDLHGMHYTKGPTPGLSSDEFKRCRQAGICFKCKSKGHIARSCPSTQSKKA